MDLLTVAEFNDTRIVYCTRTGRYEEQERCGTDWGFVQVVSRTVAREMTALAKETLA